MIRRRYLSDFELPKLRQCIGPLSVQQTLAPTSEYYRFNAADHSYLRLVTIFWSSHASDPDDRIQTLEIIDDLEGEKKKKELRRIADDFFSKLSARP